MGRCESGNDTSPEWAGTELIRMTLGSKPSMSDADVLPKTQWGRPRKAQEAQEESI
jgi:hypothetical protein